MSFSTGEENRPYLLLTKEEQFPGHNVGHIIMSNNDTAFSITYQRDGGTSVSLSRDLNVDQLRGLAEAANAIADELDNEFEAREKAEKSKKKDKRGKKR